MASTEDQLTALGLAIRELRLEQRKSQERLSMQTGVHRNYIGGIERGERVPTVATINSLATALGVSSAELYRRADAHLR